MRAVVAILAILVLQRERVRGGGALARVVRAHLRLVLRPAPPPTRTGMGVSPHSKKEKKKEKKKKKNLGLDLKKNATFATSRRVAGQLEESFWESSAPAMASWPEISSNDSSKAARRCTYTAMRLFREEKKSGKTFKPLAATRSCARSSHSDRDSLSLSFHIPREVNKIDAGVGEVVRDLARRRLDHAIRAAEPDSELWLAIRSGLVSTVRSQSDLPHRGELERAKSACPVAFHNSLRSSTQSPRHQSHPFSKFHGILQDAGKWNSRFSRIRFSVLRFSRRLRPTQHRSRLVYICGNVSRPDSDCGEFQRDNSHSVYGRLFQTTLHIAPPVSPALTHAFL